LVQTVICCSTSNLTAEAGRQPLEKRGGRTTGGVTSPERPQASVPDSKTRSFFTWFPLARNCWTRSRGEERALKKAQALEGVPPRSRSPRLPQIRHRIHCSMLRRDF